MSPGIEQTHEVKTFWRNEQVDEDVLCRWGVCLSGAARAQPGSWAEKGWFSSRDRLILKPCFWSLPQPP